MSRNDETNRRMELEEEMWGVLLPDCPFCLDQDYMHQKACEFCLGHCFFDLTKLEDRVEYVRARLEEERRARGD